MIYDNVGINISINDDNSYTVRVRIINPKKKNELKNGPYIDPILEKTLTAKNIKEVKGIIDEYLPGIAKNAEKEEDEFEKAFNASIKEGK